MKRFCHRYVLCVLVFFAISSAAEANKSGTSPNVLVLPQGPGSLGGVGENVKANLNMGLMSYEIKVLVPKGRGSATPDPSITYSSSGGSTTVGIGWNFSAGSSIERGTVRGLPRYTNEDVFFAGGELVKIPNSPFYRARMEGSFMRYRWVQKNAQDQRGYWIVEAPDGSKMYYGANSKGVLQLDAQVYGIQGTFRWELVTYVDRNGNRIEYSYFKEGPMAYPDQIAWVFDENEQPLYHLKFGYEERPDHISDGKPGFDLRTTRRLKEVYITSAGQRFRSYHFDFEENTGLSRLIKVTRYGRDPQKAYPVQFTMKYSDAVFSPQNSKMVTMPTSLGVDFRTNNLDFVDINGDGLPDVVDTSKAKHTFFLNELKLSKDLKQASHDFPQSGQVQNPTETSAQLSNASVQMLDFNGDGFTDLVDAVNKKVYTNQGDGKWTDSSTSLQNFPVTGKDPNMRFMDYDGDKKIDVISSDGSTTTFWRNDGKGGWTVIPGKVNIGLSFLKDRLRLIDLNGDGLQDIVHITKNTMRYRKYLGVGNWTEWIAVKVPDIDQYELSTQAQFNDVNGDGMADMVAFLGNSIVYFVNRNGVEFTAGQKLQTFKGVDIPDSTKTTVRIVDINGNGSRDIVWIDSSGKVVYLELFSKRPNLMTTISNGIGQRINVDYGSSVNFYLYDKTCDKAKDKGCAGPWQNKMPMAFTVVTQIATWASRSDKPLEQAAPTAEEKPITQQIFYHSGFYDGSEKKFRGFRKVESLQVGDSTAESRKDENHYDVGDKDTYFAGRLLRRIVSNDQGHTYHEETYTYKDCKTPEGAAPGLDPPVRFICLSATEKQLQEGLTDSSKWKTTRSEMTYDGYGNITTMTELGEKDREGDERITKTTFITPKEPASMSSPWFLRLRQKVERCNKLSPHCAEIRYYYDGPGFKGLPAGQFTRGNLSRLSARELPGKEKFIDRARSRYDRYGNLIGMQNALGLFRVIEWDETYGRFAVSETLQHDGNAMKATTRWDYAFSQVIESVDYNGAKTRYSYDSFGRLTGIFLPATPGDKVSVTYTYELKAPMSRVIMQKRTDASGPLDVKEVQCFDGMGRKLATANLLANKRYLVSGHKAFNARGSLATAFFPFEATDPCQFMAPASVPYTEHQYDGMGRIKQTTEPGNALSRFVYEPMRTTYYDQEDSRKDSPHYDTPKLSIYDGLGRLLEQQQMRKGPPLITRYRYSNINTMGKSLLTEVTFADGSKKQQEHDLLGRIIKLNDPDRGTTERVLDAEGNVILRKDADGTEIEFTYDKNSRILSRQKKGEPSTRIEYRYDRPHPSFPQATYTAAKLTHIAFPGGSVDYSYDIRGNLTHIVQTFNGHKYAFRRKLDNSNRLIEEEFPDGRKLKRQWSVGGRLIAIPGFIDKIEYDSQGRIASTTLANGVRTGYSYDARSRTKVIDVDGGKVMKLQYTYDDQSNILAIQQEHGDTNSRGTFEVDALYRLTKASLSDGKEVIDYKLDDLHNLTARISSLGAKSPIHIERFAPHKTKIHAVEKAGTRTLAYNPLGQMIKDDNRSYRWDYLHRRTRVLVDGKVRGRSWYGPDHKRLLKEEDGVHTHTLTGHYHLRDGKAVIYVTLGINRIASWAVPLEKAWAQHDLAPATGETSLTPKPDGQLTAADAWLHHASRSKLLELKTPKNPLDTTLTRTLLQAANQRMLFAKDEETKHFFHADHLGSVRAVTDESGAVVSRKAYYPYGFVRSKETTGQVFSFGYMGSERDQLTGLNAFENRFLDTHLARWQSPDSLFQAIGSTNDEFNSYGLARANPLRYRDRDGNESVEAQNNGIIVGTAVAGLFSLFVINLNVGRLFGDSLMKDNKNARRIQTARLGLKSAGLLLGAFAAATEIDDPRWAGADLRLGLLAAGVVLAALDTAGSSYLNHAKRSQLRSKYLYVDTSNGRKPVRHFRMKRAANAFGALSITATAVGGGLMLNTNDNNETADIFLGIAGLAGAASFLIGQARVESKYGTYTKLAKAFKPKSIKSGFRKVRKALRRR